MSKRFVAYCLLIAFGVLLTPRDFWHDCEENHSKHHHSSVIDFDKNHDSHFDSKCFACDYDMTAALQPLAFQFRFEKSVYHISQQVQNHLVELRYVETDCLRGPPRV